MVYRRPKWRWFMVRPASSHSRVIFIAWGSVWDSPQTTWEREFIEAIKRQQWVAGECEIFILSIDRLPEQLPPLPLPSSIQTPFSLNSPTCFHWSVRLRETERAWGLDRYFTWTGCLSCRGKLWFQALLWHYFLFPHRQITVGVISLIGIIMG